MRARRALWLVAVLFVIAPACGDDDAGPVFTAGAGGDATTTSTTASTTTSTTATTAAPATTATTGAPATTSAPANGNCGTPDVSGNDSPDVSGVTISFALAGNLQVIGDVCDNDSALASATVDNGAGFVANYGIDETGHFTSSTPGMAHIGYSEPVFVPVGSQITVTFTVADTEGAIATKSATLTVPIPNINPEFDYSKAVRHGYIVDIQGEAFDPDGEVVMVSIAWGDGSVDEHTQFEPGLQPGWIEVDGGHNYDPNVVADQTYSIVITLTDNRGGTTSVWHEVSF